MTKDINNISKETPYQSSFNSGVKYGYGKGIKTKINTLEPHPTEAIVMQFNFNDFTPYEINNILDVLADIFPSNTVVIIPDKVSLQSCSKDVLENYISMIAEIIEEL